MIIILMIIIIGSTCQAVVPFTSSTRPFTTAGGLPQLTWESLVFGECATINIILITIISVGGCNLIWLIEVINWEARLTGLQEGASPEMRGI